MNLEIKQRILNKIKEYDRIIISRHFRPDGDAIGSTKGLARIIKLTYPEKEVLVINDDYSEYLAFLGGEDEQIPDEMYADALVIVCDTATEKRVSNKKFSLGKEIIKIDHHIEPDTSYGDIVWLEEERSSLCEMIADFWLTFKDELKLDAEGATCIYTGMVTDSGRFRFSSVDGNTMRRAGALLDFGINTEWIYANLNLDDFSLFKFESYIYKKMKISPNGVAYIYVDNAMKRKFKLSDEQAYSVISYLDGIKGSLIWIAFIDSPDGTIRVRVRSRFMTVNTLAEKYRGGGHDKACGATLLSKKEIKQMVSDADMMLEEYKNNNKGWM